MKVQTMSEASMTYAFQLIEKARDHGIRLSLDNDQLVLKFSKEKTIDRSFLEELKNNKIYLIDFLRDKDDRRMDAGDQVTRAGAIYHEITTTHAWWVNPDIEMEFKKACFQVLIYKVEGGFDREILEKSVAYLVNRHESLRAAFHKVDGDFKMIVLDEYSSIFKVDFVRDTDLSGRGLTLEDFYQFAGHSFDLENGPLFLVRLVQKATNEFVLSLKLHHVIYDAWSMKILLRDLLLAYSAFVHGKEPEQKRLKYQYRDFNAFANEYIRRNCELDKKYWHSVYNSLPGNLIIPATSKPGRDASLPACNTREFTFSQEIMKSVNVVAARHHTTSFIILQAVLKSYVFAITGQHDIVVGTMNFGRDHFPDDIENQIGHYSKMYLIRTVLDPRDAFEQVVAKVKKSNDDAQRYRGYTLMEMFEGMMSSRQARFDFWKISMQYGDQIGYIKESDEASKQTRQLFDVYEIPGPVLETNNTDLKIDFVNMKESFCIRVIYKVAVFDEDEIQRFVYGYIDHLKNSI